MGKEQDLLVAVKSGDLLLVHKLLSKVKCNKTSKFGENSVIVIVLFFCLFFLLSLLLCALGQAV